VLLDLWLGKESGIDVIPEMLKRIPDIAIIVVTAFATFESAVEAMKRGACDYLPKPFTPDQVRAATRRALESVRLRHRLADAEHRLEQADDDWFQAESASYRALLAKAARAAAADAPVLLRGEGGSGKTVLARWLWQHSPRKDRQFVSVSCASLKPAQLRDAEGGTLFLDEICDLSADSQARIAKLFEERADIRIFAATNRDLEDEVRHKRFPEDLMFKLAVVTLVVPPLRERVEDIAPLAQYYVTRAAQRQHRDELELADAARRAMAAYAWPGNLRELRNAVERAVIVSPGPRIELDDLGIPSVPAPAGSEPVALGADVSLDELEREHIARVISRAPTLEVAARTLGIDASTLQRKRKRYGLS